jgi:hypothetical protein
VNGSLLQYNWYSLVGLLLLSEGVGNFANLILAMVHLTPKFPSAFYSPTCDRSFKECNTHVWRWCIVLTEFLLQCHSIMEPVCVCENCGSDYCIVALIFQVSCTKCAFHQDGGSRLASILFWSTDQSYTSQILTQGKLIWHHTCRHLIYCSWFRAAFTKVGNFPIGNDRNLILL